MSDKSDKGSDSGKKDELLSNPNKEKGGSSSHPLSEEDLRKAEAAKKEKEALEKATRSLRTPIGKDATAEELEMRHKAIEAESAYLQRQRKTMDLERNTMEYNPVK